MNRNARALREIQEALSPRPVKQEAKPHRIIDHTDDLHNTREYKELASFGDFSHTYPTSCRGCLAAQYCSACVMTGYIVTPKQCTGARATAAEAVLKLTLAEVEFKVKED